MSDRDSDVRKDVVKSEAGRSPRRDVRESAREVRSTGADFISSWCGLWGNLLIGLGEFISSPQSGSRSESTESTDEGTQRSQRLFNCGDGEFSISCGGSTAGERSKSSAKGEGVSARYADRNREADVDVKSKAT